MNNEVKTLDMFAKSYMTKEQLIKMIEVLDFKAVADFSIELITDFYIEKELSEDSNDEIVVFKKIGYEIRG